MDFNRNRPSSPSGNKGIFSEIFLQKRLQSEKQKTGQKKFNTSLFTHNEELENLPHIKLHKVKQKEETLFSNQEFSDLSLNLHPHLVACLRDRFNFTCMTSVQKQTIPVLLSGRDALVKSLTGSGKTLAYVVPIIQQLQAKEPKLKRSDGIYALVIVPTRELAMQSYECFLGLSRSFTWIVPGCLMGGEKKKSEKARIRKGLTVLVSTPGRLLDHMESTVNFDLKKVEWLIIDEADRLVDLGFEKSVSQIVVKLKEVQEGSMRQTVLLSATLSKGIEELAGLALDDPAVIDVAASSEISAMTTDEFVVPKTLKHFYVLTPVKLRLVALSAFVVDKCVLGNLKALVFMATQDMVDFHHLLFEEVLKKLVRNSGHSVVFFKLHGNMKQNERMQVFKEFRVARVGVLLCTDVAARGLDLPRVDWIMQFNAPSRPEDYVHRVGRTARIGTHGQAVIFLLPSETRFLEILQSHKINLEDIKVEELLKSLMFIDSRPNSGKIKKKDSGMEEHATSLQTKYEDVVDKNNAMSEIAQKAYTSYVRAYSSYPLSMRTIFPFKALHLGHLVKSFGLQESPSELGVKVSKQFIMQRKRMGHKKPLKRKMKISEFDSGFFGYDSKPAKKAKRQTVGQHFVVTPLQRD